MITYISGLVLLFRLMSVVNGEMAVALTSECWIVNLIAPLENSHTFISNRIAKTRLKKRETWAGSRMAYHNRLLVITGYRTHRAIMRSTESGMDCAGKLDLISR